MNEFLILVDENDNETGVLDKLSVHRKGLLHRAFSVFIFNSKKELILQQRAGEKYHSAGLWSNTCCSHPTSGESITKAVNRRLHEEMGLHCNIDFRFSFIYKTAFENGLIEHELDHVFFGHTDTQPEPNEHEVQNWKYIGLEDLNDQINKSPESYTSWLKICLPKVIEAL